jgi:hypothetical protein
VISRPASCPLTGCAISNIEIRVRISESYLLTGGGGDLANINSWSHIDSLNEFENPF